MNETSRAGLTTFKRDDKELIYDEFGWVTDLDYFDDEDEPIQLIEEVWERRSTRRIVVLPAVYSCKVEDQEPCEEDAVAWWWVDGKTWMQVCTRHRAALSGDDVTGEPHDVVELPIGPDCPDRPGQ
jgi:hypothetical protein